MKKSKNNKLKLCYITSSRSDFFIIKNLLIKLERSNLINLDILCTGSHLLKDFGYTYKDIIDNDLIIKKKIFLRDKDSLNINLFSDAVKKISKTLKKIKPDYLILLGDRFEIFAGAISGLFNKIPIVHIHGGELTYGSIDDQMRHSITKIADIHFVSSEMHKKRVIQMGENPKKVFNIGSLSLDQIDKIKLQQKRDLEKEFKFKFKKNNFLVTVHPSKKTNESTQILKSLEKVFNKINDLLIIFTYPGLDDGSKLIVNQIKKLNKSKKYSSILIKSLGQKNYFSFMKNVDIVIGNSSSGIIEAPTFKTFTLDIGTRQCGREKSKSVYHASVDANHIHSKIIKILRNKNYNQTAFNNPFFKKNSNLLAFNILKKLKKKSHNQKFFDIKF